mmetsp:Transcript_27592/g.75948  ORF Transcript_27592/g.75948 Transcript_27592/m.75948 type:complete len:273 (+) Transcript_27592:45-863(+)
MLQAKKRKREEAQARLSLKKALQKVEQLQGSVTLSTASKVLKQIGEYRCAVVLLANKIPKKYLELEDDEVFADENLTEADVYTLRTLRNGYFRPCCRSLALGKHLPASHILSIIEPIMTKCPRPKRLSEISDAVEVLLSYTDVDLNGSENLGRWDDLEKWLSGPCATIQLFHEIVDPVHLVVRPAGGATSVQVLALLNSIRIDANQRIGVAARGTAVRRSAGQPALADTYSFGSVADANASIIALETWIATQQGATLDICRITVTAGGILWV